MYKQRHLEDLPFPFMHNGNIAKSEEVDAVVSVPRPSC